jgi:hypothetical protein
MAESRGYGLGDQPAGEVFVEEFLGFLVFCFFFFFFYLLDYILCIIFHEVLMLL